MHLNELNRQKCTSVLSFQKEFNGVAICKLYVYEFGSETIDALIILQTMLKSPFFVQKVHLSNSTHPNKCFMSKFQIIQICYYLIFFGQIWTFRIV